jgi:hypothetical protein
MSLAAVSNIGLLFQYPRRCYYHFSHCLISRSSLRLIWLVNVYFYSKATYFTVIFRNGISRHQNSIFTLWLSADFWLVLPRTYLYSDM